MSKVYSFRLSEDNPRGIQAMEVIAAWVEERYSLRQLLVEALLSLNKTNGRVTDFMMLLEQMGQIIHKYASIENIDVKTETNSLSPSFVNSVTLSAKQGISLR